MVIYRTELQRYVFRNVQSVAMPAFALALALFFNPLAANEIPEGTVISANNIDALLAGTFDGKPLADLMTPVQQKLVKEYGITMPLVKASPIVVDASFKEATDKYSGSVKIDPQTKGVTGFITGVPFPKIEQDDPYAGYKLVYNFMYSSWSGDQGAFNPMIMLSIDGNKGLQKELRANVTKMIFKGRMTEPHQIDDEISIATQMVITYPADAAGVGILTLIKTDGSQPESYGYIKAMRRVRRLSGGAWKEPLGGTDLLGDEQTGLNADPRWYKDVKVIGKRWILAVAHSTNPGTDMSANNADKKYGLKLSQPPYWDFVDSYEPRQVWVVEITPNEDHISSKKIYYFEAENVYSGLPYMFESYDRSGKLWRTMEQGLYAYETPSTKRLVYAPSPVRVIDLQRNHATVAPSAKGVYSADYPAEKSNYSPSALSRIMQ